MTAIAKNASEQAVLDFFTALSTGNLDLLRPFLTPESVWEPMVRDIPGAGQYVGDAIIDVFLGPVRGAFAPGDPKVHPQTIFSDGEMVACESYSDGKLADGREYYNRYAWVFTVRDGKVLRVNEYMDSHYIARLFGLEAQ
ncbi:MAG: nuclear transport factor 2 family protein [Sphingomonas sp.]